MGTSADPFGRTAPPSRRRPRREDVVTYRVRIDLAGAEPPLWRGLELASDLMLDEVHDVIQVAFGWLDYHLHRFGSGPEYYSRETEYYRGPFEVDEGAAGVPEEAVRLDEVLVEVGDRLFYNYDFGDDWQHVITLESVEPRGSAVPRAICTDGRRPAPAEDCGGIHGYELIVAATDPTDPGHRAAVAEYARTYGDDVDPAGWSPTPFDLNAINDALSIDFGAGVGAAGAASELPGPLADLVREVRNSAIQRDLRRMIRRGLDGELKEIDGDTAAASVRSYSWLLNHVGDEGITLTGAGYLPPSHVRAAVDELGLADTWIGKGNREIQTWPVLNLRESAQKMGLLRKHRGRLLQTDRGRTLQAEPVALWWHLAERMPVRSTDECAEQAGLIVLIAVAADNTTWLKTTLRDVLAAIGWVSGDGTPLTEMAASYAARDTRAILRDLGVFEKADVLRGGERNPTPEGVAYARAALRSWPHPNH